MKNRKKYTEAIVVGILVVLLVGTVSASTIEEDTWWEGFLENLFTSLGQQVGCETYPDKIGTFNSPKTVYCTGGEFPGTDDCLINVFHANYQGTQPAFECGNFDLEGEVNNCLEYIVTTGSRTIYPLGIDSIYEVYNCPIGSLSDGDNQIGDCNCDYGATMSTCDSSNTCGVNKPKCMEQSGDDVCVTTGQYAIECPNGLDGSSRECDCDSNYFDSTWKNQRCPSIEPYCVDNSIMGTSYDACSTSATGIGIEKCSEQGGKICSPGQSCSTGLVEASDTNYCCLGTCEDIPTNGDGICLSQGAQCEFYCESGKTNIGQYDCGIWKSCCKVDINGNGDGNGVNGNGEDEVESKAIPLTEEEWNQATPRMIVSAMCQVPSDCTPRGNYTVKCIYSNEIKQINKNSANKLKESEGDFVEKLCQGVKFSWADIGIVGILKGAFWLQGGGYLYNLLCTDVETEISGTCRVDSKRFFSNFAFLKITGDKNTDGAIILGGGILILFIIFSRLGGLYGEIKYEI